MATNECDGPAVLSLYAGLQNFRWKLCETLMLVFSPQHQFGCVAG
jgi:hypothetical protein